MTDVRPDLEMKLERMTTAPHDARSAVRQLLGAAAEDEFWQNALLATSEIVTHSLTNTSGESRLSAWYTPATGWLRVEVTDGGGGMPSLGPGSAPDSGHPEVDGLRLAVLLEVPSAWGIERTPFGRIVWFEVQQRGPDSSGRTGSGNPDRDMLDPDPPDPDGG